MLSLVGIEQWTTKKKKPNHCLKVWCGITSNTCAACDCSSKHEPVVRVCLLQEYRTCLERASGLEVEAKWVQQKTRRVVVASDLATPWKAEASMSIDMDRLSSDVKIKRLDDSELL